MIITIDAYRSLLGRLTSIRDKMKSAAIAWRACTPQISVQHGIEFARYGERLVLELFVEVSTRDGKSLCWWIDIEPQDRSLFFEATLRKNNGIQEMQVWERSEKHQSADSALDLVEALMLEVEKDASILGSSLFDSPEVDEPIS